MTGAVALYLQGHPRATIDEVNRWIVDNSTTGAITGQEDDTPNRPLLSGRSADQRECAIGGIATHGVAPPPASRR